VEQPVEAVVEEDEPVAGPSSEVGSALGDFEDGSDQESDGELVHEALTSTSSRKRKQATKLPKYTPADETSQDRDRRSIFVGNLPIEVAKSKVCQPY
jgi:nucleolar protein 12